MVEGDLLVLAFWFRFAKCLVPNHARTMGIGIGIGVGHNDGMAERG